jgi:hypothetical protein
MAIVHLAQQQMMANTCDDELEFDTISKSIDVIKGELNFALSIVKQLDIMDKDDDAWKNIFNLPQEAAFREEQGAFRFSGF